MAFSMNKGGFLDDTFEKAIEAGQSMAKSGSKQIKQTFNPLQILKNATGQETLSPEEKKAKEQMEKLGKEGKNNTPLDFDKLQNSYGKQDKDDAKILANKLFQMVKTGEERVLIEKKQKEEEKKRQELMAAEEKKRKAAHEQRQQQSAEMPQGKERKSILGGKKKKSGSTPAPTEVKPSQGKQ